MRALISEGESKNVRFWLRVYALGATGVWLLSLSVCRVAATPRPHSYFAPPVDVLPWAVFGVVVFGAAAAGAVRGRTWAAYVGLFGGLCAEAYQVTDPTEFGQMATLFYTRLLLIAVLIVHVPVVLLSMRRDALAGVAWVSLAVLLAAGLSIAWSVGLRTQQTCHAGARWQQQLACPEETLLWREQGRTAAHNDIARGVHRQFIRWVPCGDAAAYQRWLWSEYGVSASFVAEPAPVHEREYVRAYVMEADLDMYRHMDRHGGWHRVEDRWRAQCRHDTGTDARDTH